MLLDSCLRGVFVYLTLAALLDMELASFWDVSSLLYYSLEDISVCWSVLFEEGYSLLLISTGTFVTACSGLGAGLKVFFFWV